MNYKIIDQDKFIVYDVISMDAKIYSFVVIKKEIEDAEKRLAELPKQPTDEELLLWAKENHPQAMDYSKEKEALQKTIAENTAILASL